MKILHFADAHIDMLQGGRLDSKTGLPIRVMDFLRSIDTIIETAITEKVDMVIFAGDAYKDRTPAPTYQREFAKRIFKLSEAKIPTLLLVGNHDVSPASGRANTLHEFDTLAVPFVRVSSVIEFLKPKDLWGLPVQIICVPWVNRSAFMAAAQDKREVTDTGGEIEERVTNVVQHFIDALDPELPAILTAHASVQGAMLGNERAIMLGKDMVMPSYLVKDPRLDYVALGHIHKYQDLNAGHYPPVVYPGSIERIDFGEINDEKGFVLANVEKGKTTYEKIGLVTRNFIQVDYTITKDKRLLYSSGAGEDEKTGEIATGNDITETIIDATKNSIFGGTEGAMIKIKITYPKEIEDVINDHKIHAAFNEAFELHLVKIPKQEQVLRMNIDIDSLQAMTPMQLLAEYFKATGNPDDFKALEPLAQDIINEVDGKEMVFDQTD